MKIHEMPETIGNLKLSDAAEKAARHGYTRPVKAVCSWSGYRKSGSEVWRADDCPSVLDGEHELVYVESFVRRIEVVQLTEGGKMVFVPLDDVLAVIKWEDYGGGQSSTWYFAR